MTAPERLSDTAPWQDWFERAMNSGAPNLDNVTDPDVIGPYGLEWDHCACGTRIPGDVDECDECRAAA